MTTVDPGNGSHGRVDSPGADDETVAEPSVVLADHGEEESSPREDGLE